MKNEAGFSLIDSLVALALVALIALGGSAAVVHILKVSKQSSEWGEVVHETGTAGYWVGHDLMMADPELSAPGSSDDELLNLAWKDWATGIVYYVSYTVVEQPDSLKRIERIYYTSANSTPTVTVIADGLYLAEILRNDPIWKLTIGSRDGSRSWLENYDIYPRVNYQQVSW